MFGRGLRWGLAAGLGLGGAMGAAMPAVAAPVDFACTHPITPISEVKPLSRYGANWNERVYRLKLDVNSRRGDDGIAVTSKQSGVCRIILPVGAYFTQLISWRRADGSEGVYKGLRIRESGEPGQSSDWLVINPKDPTVSGETTLEVELHFDYPDQNP